MTSNNLVFSNEKDSSIVVWKAFGERWYAAIISKATTDRIGELVTKTGMDFAISTAKRHDYHSGLYIEHAVPWTRIGRSVREMRIGKAWAEIGKFYKNPLANLAYKVLQKAKEGAIRLSVGFLTPVKQRKAGVYTKLLKFDTSLVLKPAHPDTKIFVGGNEQMSDLMQRVLKLLGPENEKEEEQAMAMLKELFARSKSMDDDLARVGKAGKEDNDEKKSKFPAFLKKVKAEDKELFGMLEKMIEASPDDEEIKKVHAAMKKRMAAYPDAEEEKKQVPPDDDEDEDAVAAKTKSGESVQTLLSAVAEIIDARLAPITETLAGLSKAGDQVEGLVERVKNLEANDQAAEVITALVKRLPKVALAQPTRPSDEAEDVGGTETADLIEELQKRLDFDDNAKVEHPLAHFVGGGGE